MGILCWSPTPNAKCPAFSDYHNSRQDEDGRSPLHFAADRGHPTAILRLLELGASVDARDSDGMTPLAYAVACEHEQEIRLLVSHEPSQEQLSVHALDMPLRHVLRKVICDAFQLWLCTVWSSHRFGFGDRLRSCTAPIFVAGGSHQGPQRKFWLCVCFRNVGKRF